MREVPGGAGEGPSAPSSVPPFARRVLFGGRLNTVRTRATLATVLVVAVALAAGAVALVTTLRTSLTDEVRSDARARAGSVSAALDSGTVPPLEVSVPDEELVQILDSRGAVVASSANVDGAPAVVDLEPGESTRLRTPLDEDDEFVAVATGARDGERTVIVARALVDVLEGTRALITVLVPGLSALLLLVAVATWSGVGRALSPVERMRAEVERISSSALHRRVPTPAGHDEIARLAGTMNRMLGRLQGAQETQRRFLSDASHELRSPVAAIRQHSEVALAHPHRTTVTDLARTVLGEDLRVQRLVEDLLLLARADEHALGLRLLQVDVDDVVFAEARRLRRSYPGLRIDTSGVGAARTDADADALERVLRNLGDNAARHARSRIAMSLTEGPDGILLRVDDDGPGIPPEERGRVMDRFVRLDEARARRRGGSGLGLAIVRELVVAHGGEVTVLANDWNGARVEVVLPRL